MQHHFGYVSNDKIHFTTSDGVHFEFQVGAYTTYTDEDGKPIQMKSCKVTLQVTAVNEGALAEGFKDGSVIEGMQERTVDFVLEQ